MMSLTLLQQALLRKYPWLSLSCQTLTDDSSRMLVSGFNNADEGSVYLSLLLNFAKLADNVLSVELEDDKVYLEALPAAIENDAQWYLLWQRLGSTYDKLCLLLDNHTPNHQRGPSAAKTLKAVADDPSDEETGLNSNSRKNVLYKKALQTAEKTAMANAKNQRRRLGLRQSITLPPVDELWQSLRAKTRQRLSEGLTEQQVVQLQKAYHAFYGEAAKAKGLLVDSQVADGNHFPPTPFDQVLKLVQKKAVSNGKNTVRKHKTAKPLICLDAKALWKTLLKTTRQRLSEGLTDQQLAQAQAAYHLHYYNTVKEIGKEKGIVLKDNEVGNNLPQNALSAALNLAKKIAIENARYMVKKHQEGKAITDKDVKALWQSLRPSTREKLSAGLIPQQLAQLQSAYHRYYYDMIHEQGITLDSETVEDSLPQTTGKKHKACHAQQQKKHRAANVSRVAQGSDEAERELEELEEDGLADASEPGAAEQGSWLEAVLLPDASVPLSLETMPSQPVTSPGLNTEVTGLNSKNDLYSKALKAAKKMALNNAYHLLRRYNPGQSITFQPIDKLWQQLSERARKKISTGLTSQELAKLQKAYHAHYYRTLKAKKIILDSQETNDNSLPNSTLALDNQAAGDNLPQKALAAALKAVKKIAIENTRKMARRYKLGDSIRYLEVKALWQALYRNTRQRLKRGLTRQEVEQVRAAYHRYYYNIMKEHGIQLETKEVDGSLPQNALDAALKLVKEIAKLNAKRRMVDKHKLGGSITYQDAEELWQALRTNTRQQLSLGLTRQEVKQVREAYHGYYYNLIKEQDICLDNGSADDSLPQTTGKKRKARHAQQQKKHRAAKVSRVAQESDESEKELEELEEDSVADASEPGAAEQGSWLEAVLLPNASVPLSPFPLAAVPALTSQGAEDALEEENDAAQAVAVDDMPQGSWLEAVLLPDASLPHSLEAVSPALSPPSLADISEPAPQQPPAPPIVAVVDNQALRKLLKCYDWQALGYKPDGQNPTQITVVETDEMASFDEALTYFQAVIMHSPYCSKLVITQDEQGVYLKIIDDAMLKEVKQYGEDYWDGIWQALQNAYDKLVVELKHASWPKPGSAVNHLATQGFFANRQTAATSLNANRVDGQSALPGQPPAINN